MSYSADKKPGELTALTSLATDDVFVVGDTSDASEVAKGITKANLITDLGSSFEAKKGADDNYVTDAEKIVIGNTSGTNTGDNAVNSNYSGLVTNATHTGEVTGSGALTLDKTAITGKTAVTAVGTDYVLISDTSDTGNLKKALVSDFGTGSVEGTAILSTGEVGGTKFLREDGDGTCSWQTPAGAGNVSKVGTPVDNQIGVWTGDGTIEGDAGLTFDGGLNITVADAENKVGLTINQNDVTNIKAALNVNGPAATAGAKVTPETLVQFNDEDGSFSDWSFRVAGGGRPYINLLSTRGTLVSPTPTTDGDRLGVIQFLGRTEAGDEDAGAYIVGEMTDATDASLDTHIYINTSVAGTTATRLDIGNGINGIGVGTSTLDAIVTSRGNNDLILQTGNTTTGNITIVDGANGNVQVNPNGTGALAVSTTIELGHASDTTLSRVSAGVVAIEGNNIITADRTASDTVVGIVEIATTAETNTGTDAGRAVSADGLAGSYAGTKSLSVQVYDGTTDVATGDGKAYITIPEALNGMNLVRAQATVVTAGTTNATTVMIHNKTDAQDMLSGAISIASGGTVGTVGTINTTYDDVATNDVLRIDVDGVSTTAPKGLMVVLEFRLP